jgi:hypothetical protein
MTLIDVNSWSINNIHCHALPSHLNFNSSLAMTKEYYLDPSLLETCHFAINVESIQHKSLARIVASTQQHKVKHKQ